jgi:hypothetical protein
MHESRRLLGNRSSVTKVNDGFKAPSMCRNRAARHASLAHLSLASVQAFLTIPGCAWAGKKPAGTTRPPTASHLPRYYHLRPGRHPHAALSPPLMLGLWLARLCMHCSRQHLHSLWTSVTASRLASGQWGKTTNQPAKKNLVPIKSACRAQSTPRPTAGSQIQATCSKPSTVWVLQKDWFETPANWGFQIIWQHRGTWLNFIWNHKVSES